MFRAASAYNMQLYIFPDMSLADYQYGFLQSNIAKDMRDFYVKDDFEEESQRYDDDELAMAENMMFQDVSALG